MTKKQKTDFKELLKQPAFREFLHDLILDCKTFEHGFIPADSLSSAFTEGQRSIGVLLFNRVLDADVYAFVKMRDEFYQRTKDSQKEDA